MSPEWIVILGIALVAASGFPALVLPRTLSLGGWIATILAAIGNVLGLVGTISWLVSGESHPVHYPWLIPGAEFSVAIDTLSSIFLIPIFLISTLGTLYAVGYWSPADYPESTRKVRFFYAGMTAGMALLVIARNSILFLVGWEIMAISAFFLVSTEDERAEVRDAGWAYLVATHCATLLLFGLFGLLRAQTGSFQMGAIPSGSISPQMQTAIFLLALLGFGFKAGIMPLHVWLPSAHASAPSHVSALMSGVLIKMGIYGLVRITSFLPNPPAWWAGLVLGLGMLSAVLGIAFAIGQHDFKRLLAYSSIENIGIIFIGLGLALLGKTLGRADWVALGAGGALFHVWNHSLFKSLLFFGAGSILHASHTRRIDLLGGLSRVMPRTAFCFLIGSLATCALPPLNGFVSEVLIYLGLFRTLGVGAGRSFASAAYAAPVLALVGGLALACFVKVYTAVFLGTARTEQAHHAHESGWFMIGPMLVQVILCLAIGLAPGLFVAVFDHGVAEWAPELSPQMVSLRQLTPLVSIGRMNILLASLIGAGAVLLWNRLRSNTVGHTGTWDCGYAAPTRTMQYTSSSFGETLVGLFSWALRPKVDRPRVEGLFPQTTEYHSSVPDPVMDRGIVPALQTAARFFSWLRILQQGHIQLYLLYILAAVVALFLM